jgi:hypothetical protein
MELNFDEERERLQAVRTELLSRVSTIDSALEALAAVNGSLVGAKPPVKKGVGATLVASAPGRRPMSAKARKAASLRMKQYWAERRKAAKPK